MNYLSKDEYQKIANSCSSWWEFFKVLGYNSFPDYVRKYVIDLGVDFSHFYKKLVKDYTKEELEIIVKESSCWKDVCRKLNYGRAKPVKKRIMALGIDTSHFPVFNLHKKGVQAKFRKFTDEDLIRKFQNFKNWTDLSRKLGYRYISALVEKRAKELGLSYFGKGYDANLKESLKNLEGIEQLEEYKGRNIPIKFKCSKHGIFYKKPVDILLLKGCPTCLHSKSSGEIAVENFLKENNYKYECQKSFEDCKYINNLLFDFYLPDYNICIEFQGIQHYRLVERFSGVEEFEKVKERDRIKKEYCRKKEIKLIEISKKSKIKNLLNFNKNNKEIYNLQGNI